ETRGEAVQIEQLEITFAPCVEVLFGYLAQPAGITQVFIDAEILIQAERLSQVSNLGPGFARVCGQHANISTALCEHAPDNPESRCFAGSVGAYQSEDFASSYFEADLIQSFDVAIALGKRMSLNYRFDGHASFRSICMIPSAGIPGLA